VRKKTKENNKKNIPSTCTCTTPTHAHIARFISNQIHSLSILSGLVQPLFYCLSIFIFIHLMLLLARHIIVNILDGLVVVKSIIIGCCCRVNNSAPELESVHVELELEAGACDRQDLMALG
jgi:hypothetical protein